MSLRAYIQTSNQFVLKLETCWMEICLNLGKRSEGERKRGSQNEKKVEDKRKRLKMQQRDVNVQCDKQKVSWFLVLLLLNKRCRHYREILRVREGQVV